MRAHTPRVCRARGCFHKEWMDLRASKSDGWGWEHEHTTNTVTRRSVEREGRRRTRALLLVLRCTVHSRVAVVAMRGNEATCASTLAVLCCILIFLVLFDYKNFASRNTPPASSRRDTTNQLATHSLAIQSTQTMYGPPARTKVQLQKHGPSLTTPMDLGLTDLKLQPCRHSNFGVAD